MTLRIAVARVRNEDDIIEPVLRHHAALVDRLILLDNARNDCATLLPLNRCRDGGFDVG